jgi:OTU domain-containing protein 3
MIHCPLCNMVGMYALRTCTHAHTVDELSKDGTYAGNDAIVAVSRAYGVDVVIHQLGAARWEVRAPGVAKATLHIAYLRGEHYCSVQPLTPGQSLPPVVR